MPKGLSLHVGLNSVDPAAYDGWDGALVACEADAHSMEAICAARGFATQQLLTAEATSDALLEAIDRAAEELVAGDVFLISYAGHGGQIPDESGDEPDRMDETWVLRDRQVIDDELLQRWARFAEGVRVVVLSDSCHSGSVVKAQLAALGEGQVAQAMQHGRFMPADVNRRDNAVRRDLYTGLKADARQPQLQGRVLLLAGCQDNQTAADGDSNGLFTGTLLEVWRDGAFTGGYRTLLTAIKRKMPPWQSPNYLALNDASREFNREHPFTV